MEGYVQRECETEVVRVSARPQVRLFVGFLPYFSDPVSIHNDYLFKSPSCRVGSGLKIVHSYRNRPHGIDADPCAG